jgi:hypothetical protein
LTRHAKILQLNIGSANCILVAKNILTRVTYRDLWFAMHEQDISGSQVTMHDLICVQVQQSLGNAGDELQLAFQ